MTNPPNPADPAGPDDANPRTQAWSGPPAATATTGAPAGMTVRARDPRRFGRAMLSSGRTGVAALVVAVLLLLVMALTPTAYVLRQPGPVFNALGDVVLEEGADPVPVLTIEGAETYDPGDGRLDVMTVNILGSPRGMPGWVEAFVAYASGDRVVMPVEVYYPPGQTAEDRANENESMMQQSQGEAIAAALRHLGHEIDIAVVVSEVNPDGPADGALQPGDRIISVDGVEIDGFDAVRQALDGNTGTPVPVTADRGGEPIEVQIAPSISTPEGEAAPRPLLGITVVGAYDFPVDVSIQLGDVGGPSAGLIFALSIIDLLTPGSLTAGHHFAGTGTITADGEVGPIGGIRQKLFAAADEGAEAFLAPIDNCEEALTGGVPGNLPVYAIATLDDALLVIETLASGDDTSALPTCQSAIGG
ncbi:hypothetical protein GCM10011490_07270 [Pseudoclavibacter endophyticus]|uniref:PDZ domain-containing protein n=1 Tax=Pseudoclavibacter endophyticus TaxID=1778590 RepID=A0A6H9WQ12_9MICO|nr:PDZ domain-containing protein [Pseudoclavibacter endophyticus]KAB1649791.1 PDZ domain-containing protein [Pseudoclavibacter endophyticus]GGA59727.1 hypothetical protein GCM10011490_07270 [Pseudoclavibacter endophyticus]